MSRRHGGLEARCFGSGTLHLRWAVHLLTVGLRIRRFFARRVAPAQRGLRVGSGIWDLGTAASKC